MPQQKSAFKNHSNLVSIDAEAQIKIDKTDILSSRYGSPQLQKNMEIKNKQMADK